MVRCPPACTFHSLRSPASAPPHAWPLWLAVTTLTAAHLVVTALGLELATRLHLFDAKPMDNKCVGAHKPAWLAGYV